MPLSKARKLGPEDHELAQKRADLAALRATLLEREVEVEDLRAQVASFRGVYLRRVGTHFAELAEWRARILELKAVLDPSDEAKARAQAAREQARQSFQDTHGEEAEAPAFQPSPALRTLYRDLARRIHPDFCQNAEGLERRTRFMAEANRAYEANDVEALQRILDEYHEGIEATESEGPNAELSRLNRQIIRAKGRMAALDRETDALGKSQMGMLKRDSEIAEQEGRDLLAELAKSVMEQIGRAEVEFKALSRDVGLREALKANTVPQ
jgi:hypothetical protein